MYLSELDFVLNVEQIAENPLSDRSSARLLVVKNNTLRETTFKDIKNLFNNGDVLVLNDSKVIKSRILTNYQNKNLEIFFHKNIDTTKWLVFAKPAKKISVGQIFSFKDHSIKIIENLGQGEFQVELNLKDISWLEFFEKFGHMPLPPYIKRQANSNDDERYQTVYAHTHGSVAAPTAGLHFSKELIEELKAKGIHVVYITLHVGAGTFLPIKTQDINLHKMHYENYEISNDTADIINQAKAARKRIIAVGSTTIRTLEASNIDGIVVAQKSSTNLFIKPGFKFKIADLLITNFHLPKSTLLLLVWAFGGINNMKKAYKYALENNFRLFSYGDTSIIYKNE